MSFFSFLKRNKENYSLVFGVNSGSISGALVKITEKAGVEVIYYEKENFVFQSEILAKKHLESLKSSLSILAEKIRLQGIKKINSQLIGKTFYLFASPWCQTQTKTIRIKVNKSFKVTEVYLERIISEQEHIFQNEMVLTGKIIERKIIQVKINGYEVNNIINRWTQDLEITVLFTVVALEVLQAIEKTVNRPAGLKNVWCHSATLAVFSSIRNLFPQVNDYINIAISEEITDISIIKDDIIVSSSSLPFGRNNFIRKLSQNLSVSEEIADSMIKIQDNKINNDLASLKLAVAMDKAAQDWIIKIFEILDNYKEKIYVPESVFLVVNNDINIFLRDKLQKHDFRVNLLNCRKIKSPVPITDVFFKLELMFLDKSYKI